MPFLLRKIKRKNKNKMFTHTERGMFKKGIVEFVRCIHTECTIASFALALDNGSAEGSEKNEAGERHLDAKKFRYRRC